MKKNESGIISYIVIFFMSFLLIFTVGIFSFINSNKTIVQDQNYDYKSLFNNNPSIINAKNTEIIPISNADEFNIVGSGYDLKKNNVIYSCGIGMSYVLRENIIVDIDEEVKESKYDFFDYKLYSKNYHIDTNDHDIYYYKDGLYYKVLVYQKFTDEKENSIIVDNTLKEKDNFSRIDLLDNNNSSLNILLLWKDKDTLKYNEFSETINANKLKSTNSIKVLQNQKKEILDKAINYYIFISKGNSI